MRDKATSTAIALIGILTLVPGFLEIIFSLAGRSYTWSFITFSGEFVLWRGVILVSSGFIYLFALNQPDRVQKHARGVLASLMIWIVAGGEALSLILGSIPGEGGRWITTLEDFASSYHEPVAPSLLLLPITLALVLWIYLEDGKYEKGK
ncbi:MAG: hypothetical protein ACLFN7_01105 [Candidatus Acetothermia bacterium]